MTATDTAGHNHSKQHTLQNTHSIIKKPCENTHTHIVSHKPRQIIRPMCLVILMFKKTLHSAQVGSVKSAAAFPTRCTAVYFPDSRPVCVYICVCVREMRLLVFGEWEGLRAADRMLTSWVLLLETLQTSRKQTHGQTHTHQCRHTDKQR